MKRSSRRSFLSVTVALVAVLTGRPLQAWQNFVIANTAQREMSIGAAYDGTNFLVGIQGDSAHYASIGAQLVSPAGTKIGPLIASGRTGGVPYVAFGGGHYLLVWSDDAFFPNDDIWGMFVTPAGVASTPFAIDTSPLPDETLGLASDGTDFFVSYAIGGTQPPYRTVNGRLITSTGSVGSEVSISTGKGANVLDGVAFGGGQYLVVWTEDQYDLEVRGRFVSAAGVPGTEFSINTSTVVQDGGVGVEFDGTNFLVVWTRDYDAPPGYGAWDVLAQRVSPAGVLLGGLITVSDSHGSQQLPFAGFDGANYLVTWTEQINDIDRDGVCDGNEATCVDVSGQFVSPGGALLGPAFSITHQPGHEYLSPVTFGGSRFLVTLGEGTGWSDSDVVNDVFGTFVDPAAWQAPAAYCISKVNSLGCTPLITWSGTPRVGNPAPFTIEGLNIRNQKLGLLLYGKSGQARIPFQGGYLCFAQPLRRTPAQTSGGSAAGNDCTGMFHFDFNNWIAGGLDPALVPGQSVWAQFWSRDPGFAPPNSTSLTNGIEFTIAP